MLRSTTRLLTSRFHNPFLNCSRDFHVNSLCFANRWVSPTLRELQHRRKKFKSEIYTSRNTFPEWNYNAEIFAFGKRLNEAFNTEHLQTAFVDPSYVAQEEFRQKELGVETSLNIKNNRNLIEIGEKCISDYVQSYLQYFLPNCPQEGIIKIFNWLTSEENLANISSNIGTKDLILCADNNPTDKILRDTFVAVIGALRESSGDQIVYTFIRDFICTQLNQKDLTEVWVIDNPLDELKRTCKEKNLGEPEPRLIGQNGSNTVLATYYVCIYENKKNVRKRIWRNS